MEQFKALDDDWRQIGVRAKNYPSAEVSRAVLELRDRVAALEAAPDRVLVRSQTGEYLRAGTPLYLDSRNRLVSYSVGEARPWKECGKDHAVPSPAAAPAAAVPSDQELWEVQLKVKSLSRPHIGWQVWSPESEPLIAAHRALYNYGYERGQTDGYEQGLAAGRAEQQATKAVRVVLPETPCYPDLVSGGAYYLHGYDDAWAAARAMVEQQQAAQSDPVMATPEPEPTHPSYTSGHGVTDSATATVLDAVHHRRNPEPEPSPSPADGWLIAALEGMGLDDATARRVLLIVARWLAKRCSSPDGKESRWLIDSILQILHEEANR